MNTLSPPTEPTPLPPLGRDRWSKAFDIFSALEKILVVIGVPIAAYWTYFTFITNDSQKARLHYETDLARAKSFGLQIDVTAASEKEAGAYFVNGTVTVKNMGVQYVMMDGRSQRNVGIGKLDIKADIVRVDKNQVFWRQGLDLRGGNIDQVAVAPQRTVVIPYLFRVPSPGYYLVQFNAPVRFASEGKYTSPRSWGAKTIVHVPAGTTSRSDLRRSPSTAV